MKQFLKNNKQLLIGIIIGVAIVLLFSYIFLIPKNNSLEKESLFDKQERCAKSREGALKQLEDTYKIATPYFYEIFYSPKTKTCVYTYGLLLVGQSPNEVGSFVIADYFTGDTLFSVDYDNSSGDESQYSYTMRPKFSEKVEYYKK